MVEPSCFDGAEVPHDFRHDKMVDADRATAAMSAFLSCGPVDRLADSRDVWACYSDYSEIVGAQDRLDAEMGVPASPEAIWAHVHPQPLYLTMGGEGDPACHVVVDCDCDGEEEHGLMLVWRDGQRLTKAGGFDGHVTSIHADDKPVCADVGYTRSLPEYLTRLDGP